MTVRYYTGVGNREIPDHISKLITRIAKILDLAGYTLRSGAAKGADAAFELGARRKEIYLPWPKFNGHPSLYHTPSDEAIALANRVHPFFYHLTYGAKKLMARNSHEVLGLDLKTPSVFLVCYTRDGCETLDERSETTGGTGQAIAIACHHRIPVFNLQRSDSLLRLSDFTGLDVS